MKNVYHKYKEKKEGFMICKSISEIESEVVAVIKLQNIKIIEPNDDKIIQFNANKIGQISSKN